MTTTDQAAPAAEAVAPADEAQRIWNQLEAEEAAAEKGEAAPPEPASDPAPAPAPTPDKGATATDPKAAPAAAAPVKDIWSDVPEEARTAYSRLEKDHKALLGRVAPLQRELRTLQRQARTAPGAPSPDGKAADEILDPETLKALDAVEKDFPDVAKPFRQVINRLTETVKTVRGETSSLRQERKADVEDATVESQNAFIRQHHQDFDAIAGSTDFYAWVEKQPAFVKNAVKRNTNTVLDPQEIVDVVSAFKRDTGRTTPEPSARADTPLNPSTPTADPKRARQLRAATSPRTTAPGAVSTEPPPDAPASVWWDYFDRQERAKEAAA